MIAATFDLRDRPAALPALAPGERQRLRVVFVVAPDGSEASFPLIAIAGRRPGKTALFIAGIHGDEYEGPAALWQLADSLDPEQISGRILIVPIANGAAFSAGTRTSPADDVNLARIFPGDPHGTLSYRLADALMRYVVAEADLLVDSHSGGSRLAFVPLAGFYAADRTMGISEEAGAQSLAMARAMRLPFLWRLPPVPGVLSFEAARRGIAVTGCEVGGRGGCLPGDVELYLRGYRAVLVHAGLIGGSVPTERQASYLEGDWERADQAGYLSTHVEPGARVEAGELIATLRNPFGDRLAEFRAANAGIVMAVRHLATVGCGDLTTCVVREVPL